MRLAAFALLIAACEKQGPVESTPGVSSSVGSNAAPTVKPLDAGVATTTRTDAARAGRPDAAVQIADEDAIAMVDTLAADTNSNYGDMSGRNPGRDLQQQIDEARQQNAMLNRGSGSSAGPPGRVTISSKQAFDESTLLPDLVVSKILSVYMAGIKRCYKTHLEQDPAARGRVRLSFTVNETGRVLAPKVTGFATAIDDCLKGQLPSWRFPIPKDKDGEATDAAFEIGLQLVPD
jgi:hypothetical protein